MPPPQNDFDREMRMLESELKRLEAEYTMFFSGRLPRLPWERKARVETLVRTFDRAEGRNTADRFRFQMLQTRFVKFLERWDRQLRDREEGGRPKTKRGRSSARAATKPAEPTPPASTEPAPPPPPAERELHVVTFEHASATTDRVTELYERLAEAKRQVGETSLGRDRIAALVNAQLQKHGNADGEVAFRIAVKDGKVSLTVKPVKD
ncbi:MAG: MXAN_5187 C-terminal domain-containing protein [Vicinamibacterales bacterium]